MDVEGQRASGNGVVAARRGMSRGLKWALVTANCLLALLGNTGGPLLLRLYYTRGGGRKWLSSWLQSGGWPLLLLPLVLSYYRRRRPADGGKTKVVFITWRLFLAFALLGLFLGADDFLYSFGLSFLPVSTSALLVSTQLVFTACFAFVVVRQRFTPYSINAVVLLTVGAVMLGMRGSSERPAGVSRAQYYMGFFLTIGVAVLVGLILPLVELAYHKAEQAITYTLVVEMQLVMAFFATALCTVGMIINNDFKVIPREASQFELGEVRYYVVLVCSAIFWQMNYMGLVGVIFCVNTLTAGILSAVSIPMVEVLGVIFFNEKFNGEKGVSLALSLWGLASYSYGEYRAAKDLAALAN